MAGGHITGCMCPNRPKGAVSTHQKEGWVRHRKGPMCIFQSLTLFLFAPWKF